MNSVHHISSIEKRKNPHAGYLDNFFFPRRKWGHLGSCLFKVKLRPVSFKKFPIKGSHLHNWSNWQISIMDLLSVTYRQPCTGNTWQFTLGLLKSLLESKSLSYNIIDVPVLIPHSNILSSNIKNGSRPKYFKIYWIPCSVTQPFYLIFFYFSFIRLNKSFYILWS